MLIDKCGDRNRNLIICGPFRVSKRSSLTARSRSTMCKKTGSSGCVGGVGIRQLNEFGSNEIKDQSIAPSNRMTMVIRTMTPNTSHHIRFVHIVIRVIINLCKINNVLYKQQELSVFQASFPQTPQHLQCCHCYFVDCESCSKRSSHWRKTKTNYTALGLFFPHRMCLSSNQSISIPLRTYPNDTSVRNIMLSKQIAIICRRSTE